MWDNVGQDPAFSQDFVYANTSLGPATSLRVSV